MEYRYLRQIGTKPRIEFSRDIPFPSLNLNIYRELYHIEQWLRRILYSIMMFTYGESWEKAIPSYLFAELERSRKYLRGRILLDDARTSNLLWLLTLDELNELITSDNLWPILRKFIAYPRTELYAKINILRDTRNVIAHNRAASDQTWNTLSGIIETLNSAIKQFKNEVSSFKNITERLEERGELTDQKSKAIFEYCAEKTKPNNCNISLWGRDYFFELFSCPLELNSTKCWTNIARILEDFQDLDMSILAFKLSDIGPFSVIWPRNILHENHFKIIDRFFLVWPDLWTSSAFTFQDPKYVCDPKVWLNEHVVAQSTQEET